MSFGGPSCGRWAPLYPHFRFATAAVQGRWAAHPPCPILHLAAGGESLDADSLSADSRVHRPTRVVPDLSRRNEQREGDAAAVSLNDTVGVTRLGGHGAAQTTGFTRMRGVDELADGMGGSLDAPGRRSVHIGNPGLVDAILTPTREPSLISCQVQQRPRHPRTARNVPPLGTRLPDQVEHRTRDEERYVREDEIRIEPPGDVNVSPRNAGCRRERQPDSAYQYTPPELVRGIEDCHPKIEDELHGECPIDDIHIRTPEEGLQHCGIHEIPARPERITEMRKAHHPHDCNGRPIGREETGESREGKIRDRLATLKRPEDDEPRDTEW
jgi:hypothetical protein